MHKKHLGLQVLLALLLTAAVIFGVEGVCNLPLNRLPEGQRGEITPVSYTHLTLPTILRV